MFYRLPAETYIEIQKASKRRTSFLLFFLFIFYFVTFYILLEFTIFASPFLIKLNFQLTLSAKLLIIFSTSFLSTYFHYIRTIQLIIPNLISLFNIENCNPDDNFHKVFSNVVGELCQAAGIYNVRAGIISTTSTNAFSISDGKKLNFIVITEGLLARLNRSQLEAVIAHEFAHIVHGDSVLATLSCSLFGIFEQILEALKKKNIGAVVIRTQTRRSPFFILYFSIIKLICSFSIIVSKIIMVFISRQRETLADATSVKLTRNPIGLAEALYKIAHNWRGEGFIAKGFSPVFILNPHLIKLDEQENIFADLFSTHPPLKKRLNMLMRLAKESVSSLQSAVSKPEYKISASQNKWWVVSNNNWLGPFTQGQLTSVAGLVPLTWICKDGTKDIKRLKDESELSSVVPEPKIDFYYESLLCPRCNKTLVKTKFEGVSVRFCIYCKGHLVKDKNLTKIIARHHDTLYKNIIDEVKAIKNNVSKERKTLEADGFSISPCPRCKKRMTKFFHSYNTFIILDKCYKCNLIWFDEKELEYINSLVAIKS